METHPFIMAERPWLKKILPHAKNRGQIYTHGVHVLKSMCNTFYKREKHKIPKFSQEYEPNPWEYQYDLELFIFINYQKISDAENIRLHDRIRREDAKGEERDTELIEKLWQRLDFIKENGVTGLPREEHWWNASEIRWPTTVAKSGEYRGQMIRDPWAQRRIRGLCKGYNLLFNFGGGMQGKTHTYCGFLITMFDHYVHTQRGAKCSFSTTSETKLKNAAWPAITRLMASSESDCSLVIGQSVVAGDFTVRRVGNKTDTGGVIKGVLLGKSLNESEVIDKLTGAHGHSCYVYLIDECQSTPLAPIKASRNFLMNLAPAWVIGTGNYDKDDDGLGVNVKPVNGWDSVTENTEEWISKSCIGQNAYVMHFSNSLSPAYLNDDLAKKFAHMPNKESEKLAYATKSERTIESNEYRRMWLGWRSTDFDESSALNLRMVEKAGADQVLTLDPKHEIYHFFSLDPNKAQVDRARLSIFADGIDAATKEWVFGIVESIEIPLKPSIIGLNRYVVSEILKHCQRYGIDSGIMDWSDMNSIYSDLVEAGLNVMPMIYHASIPDGKTRDKYTNRVERKIAVNANTNTYAHQKCSNRITLGAYAIREYCKAGKLRGINDAMRGVNPSSDRSLSDELFLRKIETINRINSATGSLFNLDSKEDFKKKHKFSPDIFDTLAQAGYYALVKRGIPIYDEFIPQKVINKSEAGREDDVNNFEADLCAEYL